MANSQTSARISKLVQIAIVTAIVIVLQLLGSFIKFGTFSVSLVCVPIVIGAILYGPAAGAWLGLVFGATVLLSGDAASFYALAPFGTIFLVLAKGILAGFVSGLAYKALSKRKYLAVIVAAVLCPVVNTGVFLIGCLTIFRPYLTTVFGMEESASAFIFIVTAFIGLNFVFELIFNVIMAPVIVRITDLGRKMLLSRKK